MSVESRVERLIRLAEAAAVAGDFDQTAALLAVLNSAIYLRGQEIRELKRMAKVRAGE